MFENIHKIEHFIVITVLKHSALILKGTRSERDQVSRLKNNSQRKTAPFSNGLVQIDSDIIIVTFEKQKTCGII